MLLLDADKTQRLNFFGEDTCDLLRTIEVSFGVMFSEDELVEAKTIGELAECISRKMQHSLAEKCLSALVFYQVRRILMSSFGISRAKITPETPLRELLPWKDRRRRWREIQNQLRFVLPELRWPLWLIALSLVIVAAVFALPSLGWARLVSFAGSTSGLFTFFGAICAWVLLLKLLAPFARTFPRSCETFGDFVKLLLARNYAQIASMHGRSPEREVLLVLRQLVAAEVSIDVERIDSSTLFPEGLNIY
jgi:hypothetical protein